MLDVFPYWSPDIDQCWLVSRCDVSSGENSRLLTTIGPLCQRLSPGGTGVCETHVMLCAHADIDGSLQTFFY